MRIKNHIDKLDAAKIDSLEKAWSELADEVEKELSRLYELGLSDPTREAELENYKRRILAMSEAFTLLKKAKAASAFLEAAKRNEMKRYADRSEDAFWEHVVAWENLEA